MNVLLINQFFWPDAAATSQLLTDLAVELDRRGHTVHVICADAAYADASIHGDAPPAHIHRVRSLPFRRGRLSRVLSYFAFYIQALALALTLPRPALLVTLTTPPLLSLVGSLAKALRGCRHFIWEMDVYPDVATALDYFKEGSPTAKVIGYAADFSRKRADGILALGECMKERLVARGIAAERIAVVENWADGDAIEPRERPGSAEKLVLLYSGNLGLAHDVDTIADAMRALQHSDSFSFLFAGGGQRTQQLREYCAVHNLGAAAFRPYVGRDSLAESLCAGDIGLVTQADACCGSVVPSKVYGLLAAGRPILFIGPAAATPARIIRRFGCGWHVPCGEVFTLVALLQRLAQSRAEVREAGDRARETLLQHYDRSIGVARLCRALGADMIHQSLPQPVQIPVIPRSDELEEQLAVQIQG